MVRRPLPVKGAAECQSKDDNEQLLDFTPHFLQRLPLLQPHHVVLLSYWLFQLHNLLFNHTAPSVSR